MPEPLDLASVDGAGLRAVGEWRRRANCLGVDPDLFFPKRADPFSQGGKATRAAINTYCLPCPVRADCLAEGLKEVHGVWGGTTPKERRKLRVANAAPRIHLMRSFDSSTAHSAQIGAQK